MIKHILGLVFALMLSSPALAATSAKSVQAPAGYSPMSNPCVEQADGTCKAVGVASPMPTAAKQESFDLASANAAGAAVSLFGGSYALSQICTNYNSGLLTLRYRAADGVSFVGLVSRGAADSGGGTLVSLGTNSVVDVTLPAGSTGCYATLSRVP